MVDVASRPLTPATELAVLHALAVKGWAEVAGVAEFTGLAPAAATAALDGSAAAGLAVHRDGRLAGWSLTAEGRGRHAALLAADRSRPGLDEVRRGYEQFLTRNGALKDLCTRWQLDGRRPVLVARLTTLHAGTLALVGDLAEGRSRFAGYAPRFAGAHRRVIGGDDSGVARPLTGSYHDVWMELHQDLLLTLGVERSTADGV